MNLHKVMAAICAAISFIGVQALAANSVPPQDSTTLLQTLKSITDEGPLFDAARTGEMLDFKFSGGPLFRPEIAAANKAHVTTYSAESDWYKRRVAAKADVPEAVADTAPSVNYFIQTPAASSNLSQPPQTYAQLTLVGLPAFACVTQEQLQTVLNPDYQKNSQMRYVARFDHAGADFQTSLEFTYSGSPCALVARIREYKRSGKP